MDFDKIKSFFLKSLIGCLIAAATLAVVSVLAGQFNDIFGKALLTILVVAIHCLVSFGFIVNNEKQKTFDSLTFFTNAFFVIIVLSFVTAVLGIWGALPDDIVLRLYCLYFVLLFAVLHGEILAKTLGHMSNINNVVFANFIFMAIVVIMLQPLIFTPDTSLGAFYYRLLAAAGIIDGTLTLTAVILDKLYLQKHPKIKDPVFNIVTPMQVGPGQGAAVPQATPPQPAHRTNIFVILLVIYLICQIGSALVLGVIGHIHQ